MRLRIRLSVAMPLFWVVGLSAATATLAKHKLLTGSSEFDDVLERDLPEFSAGAGGDRTNLVAALERAAASLRVNWAGYTSEVRYTDRVLSFSSLFSRSDQMLPGKSDPKIVDFRSFPLYAVSVNSLWDRASLASARHSPITSLCLSC